MNNFKIEKFSKAPSAAFWAEEERYAPDMGVAFLSEGWGGI